jgi:hypothetical protein
MERPARPPPWRVTPASLPCPGALTLALALPGALAKPRPRRGPPPPSPRGGAPARPSTRLPRPSTLPCPDPGAPPSSSAPAPSWCGGPGLLAQRGAAAPAGPLLPAAAFPGSPAPPRTQHARPRRRSPQPWCPARRGPAARTVRLSPARRGWPPVLPRCLARGTQRGACVARPRRVRGSFAVPQRGLARVVSWRGSPCSRQGERPTMLVACPSTPVPFDRVRGLDASL